MKALTRRDLLVGTAAATTLTLPLGAKPLSKANLGIQLYTVRDQFPKDPSAVLKQIRSIGYTEIESTDYGDKQDLWKAISASGLKLPSVHVNAAMFDKPNDEVQTRLAFFKQLGFTYVVYPYVSPEKRGGADVYKKLAESLNKFGVAARQHGMQLCYHNHAFEFENTNGTSPLQILMTGTDPEHLALEMDIFWVTVAGQDPIQLLQTYAGRVPLLHVKDKAKGIPEAPQFNEKVPKETFKEAGNGSIDIPAVLKAADKAGVRHYFVEQDQSPDPLVSLKQSYSYLSKQFSV